MGNEVSDRQWRDILGIILVQSGQVRQWMESYDQTGNVVRVHPKVVNGQILNAPHYPRTGRELGQ